MTRAPALAGAALLVLRATLACAGTTNADSPGAAAGGSAYTFGIGTFEPSYAPPEPGSYELPPIDAVSDHPVVDADGKATTLFSLIGDRLAVVSFIYGTCSEKTGCPLSTAVLHRLDHELAHDAKSARGVALVTISFDPQRDTPERLAAMQKQRAAGSGWTFVTAPDEATLEPLLDDFGQSVTRLVDASGKSTGAFRHVLKVFLLDRRRQVRNVYSVGFLDERLIKNDLATLRMTPAK